MYKNSIQFHSRYNIFSKIIIIISTEFIFQLQHIHPIKRITCALLTEYLLKLVIIENPTSIDYIIDYYKINATI